MDWVRRMGLRRYHRLLVSAAPMLDRSMLHALYWQGEPLLLSSAFVHLLGAAARTDHRQLPKLNEPFTAHGRTGRWGHSRSWSVLHCGEIEPVPSVGDLGEISTYLKRAPQRRSLTMAAANAAVDVESRIVAVRDSGEVLPFAPELAESLGYVAEDTNWIPGRWKKPLTPGRIETGSDIIYTGDREELPSRVGWQRMRVDDDLNLYIVRLLLLDGDDYSAWNTVELSDGVPRDVGEVLARIDGRRRFKRQRL